MSPTGKKDIWTAALEFVLAHEGGLVDNPADPGGVTKWGISIRFAGSIGLDLDGDGRTTAADIVAMTPETAAGLYRLHFWDKIAGNKLDQAGAGGLAFIAFDCAVNQGPRPAARILQRIAGAVPDGLVGPKTIAAAGRISDPGAALARYAAKRGKRYATTANVETFGEGWFRRLIECHAAAAALI